VRPPGHRKCDAAEPDKDGSQLEPPRLPIESFSSDLKQVDVTSAQCAKLHVDYCMRSFF